MITQIRAFPLNLSTSNKNFETTKYSLERNQKNTAFLSESIKFCSAWNHQKTEG